MALGPIKITGALGALKPRREVRFDTTDGTMSVDGGPHMVAARPNDTGGSGLSTIMVYDFAEIKIGSNVAFHARGKHSLGLVASGDIVILQDLEASGGEGGKGGDGSGRVGAGGGGGGGGGGGLFIVSAEGYVYVDGSLSVSGGKDGGRGVTHPDDPDGGGFGGLGGAGGPGGGAGGIGGASEAGGGGAGGGSGSAGGGGGGGGGGGQVNGGGGGGGSGSGIFGSFGSRGVTGSPAISFPSSAVGGAGGDGNGFFVRVDPDGGNGGNGGASANPPIAGFAGKVGIAANGGAGGGGGGGGGGDRWPTPPAGPGGAGGTPGAGAGGSATGGGTGGAGASGGGGAFFIASRKAVVLTGDMTVTTGVGAIYGKLIVLGQTDVDVVAETGSPLDVTSVNQVHVHAYPAYLGLRPQDLYVNGGSGAGGMGGDGQAVALVEEDKWLIEAKAEILRSVPPEIGGDIESLAEKK